MTTVVIEAIALMPPTPPESMTVTTEQPTPTPDISAHYRALTSGERAAGPRGTIMFCVSTADLSEGKGDLYVAAGLASALSAEGWGVIFWPAERWNEEPPVATDVAVVMIESFVPGLLPPSTATIAWVRNWTASWAKLPYLTEFDGVWASSGLASEHLEARFGRPVPIVPIGVDEALFVDPGVERDMPIVTTANFWGVERRLRAVLDDLSDTHPVVWFGANGAHLERSPRIDHRDRVDFFELPEVYGRSQLVVDDVIDPAAEFGSQNSRIFEALSTGTPVTTNTSSGLAELGLGDLPVFDDAQALRRVVDRFVDPSPEQQHEVAEWTRLVRSRHSYSARARFVAPLLDGAIDSARGRSSRSEMLRWITVKQEELRHASRERDGHLITVRRLEREAEALADTIGDLQGRLAETVGPLEELRELKGSRAYTLLERYRSVASRARGR